MGQLACGAAPAELVRELRLKEGDQIDSVKDDGHMRVRRLPRADEILMGLRRFRRKLPAAQRLSSGDAMSAEFADTNVVLCLLDDGSKGDRAEHILGHGPRISGQVLALVNCRRKAGLSWEETAAILAGIRALCPVEELTLEAHETGRALAERYGFCIYDAMIVASALIADCTTLWSEDMQDGRLVESQLRIVNPFG